MTRLAAIIPIIFASLAIGSTASQTLPSAVRWSVALSARAVAPPTIAGSVVVVGLESGDVIAYGATDGKEAWRMPMRADQAIAADKTLLFVAAGEKIHALDAADGKVLWEAPSGSVTAPLLVQGGWVIAASAGRLTALREIDGAQIWGRDNPPQHVRPTLEGDNLYVPLDEGRLLKLDVKTGAERWQKFPAKGPLSEVLAFPDRVFVGASDKHFYAYDADDGEIESDFPIGTLLRGRPVADDERVVITGMDNLVRAFDRHSGKLDWKTPVPYRPTAPMLVGSVVVVPGRTAEIDAFDIANGKPAGQIKLEQELALPPAFAGSGADALLAAITGTLTEWRLLLAAPPAPTVPPG